jgi:Tfp pilus assembly protein PilV
MIEVVVTIAVIAIGIMALTQLFPTSLTSTKSANHETTAVNLAEAKLEEMMSIPYDEVSIGTIEPKTRLATSSSEWLYNYQRQTVVTYVDGEDLTTSATDTGLKKITTTVYWQNATTDSERSTELHLLIADK